MEPDYASGFFLLVTVMTTRSEPATSLQMQSSMMMLRHSLKQVFPAREDRSFGDLLRQLDQSSRG